MKYDSEKDERRARIDNDRFRADLDEKRPPRPKREPYKRQQKPDFDEELDLYYGEEV